jgi:predicted SprT family Zn-dependent metalloprotease
MYVCHCCGEKWFDTIYAVKGLTGKTHYCGDCFEELKILERVKKHLKETGVPEEWL